MTDLTAPAPRPSARAADVSADVQALWDQSVAWLASHYLQIAVAAVAGFAIVMALYGLRGLGARLCRDEVGATHWRTIFGRAIARTRSWFIIALAAKLVAGIAYSPAGVAQLITAAFTIAGALQCAIWARELVLGAVEHRVGNDDHGRLRSGGRIGLYFLERRGLEL